MTQDCWFWMPATPESGIEPVLINGKPAPEDSRYDDEALAGRVIKRR